MRRLTCEDGFEWYRTRNQNKEIYEKLKYYEDLEEQGILAEQKLGQWINERMTRGGFHEEWGYDCSECGKTCSYRPNYCPNCGAKMKR